MLDKLPRRPEVIVVGGTDVKPSWHAFEDLIAHADSTPVTADTLSDEIAFWLYTSGSTGDPKGVKHCHSNLMATAKLFGQGILGIRENDVVHSASKLFFAYGLGNAMTFPLGRRHSRALAASPIAGGRVRDPAAQSRDDFLWRAVALPHCSPTRRSARAPSPTSCASAYRRAKRGAYRRALAQCGRCRRARRSRLDRDAQHLSQPPRRHPLRLDGQARPRIRRALSTSTGARLVTADRRADRARASTGEGYWNQRAKSRRTFAGEWTHTGDKYRRDAEGYYYCGRTDDMFKVSGMWVSPFDVEAALVSHEAVLEAAVIGKEDADGLIKPKAFIVLRNGYKVDDGLLEMLKVHVKDKAGPWKFPRWIELRTTLPRTATGKIQRFKLREEDRQASAQ